jgi:oligoendopeptidase F
MAGGDAVALQTFINTVNDGYERVHLDFEDQFWGTKMALKDARFTTDALTETKGKMEQFLMQPEKLEETRRWIKSGLANEEQKRVLKIFERTFSCYIMESDEAKALREEVTKKESELEAQRNTMKLGADLPGEGFKEISSVGLRNRMRTDTDEFVRKACYEGVSSIGPFICTNGFCDIVKMRNRMAKKLGYVDFYDYKVQQAEGFDKKRLFEILDTLEAGTKELLASARARLASEKGDDALKPWNMGFMMAGDVTKKLDPYFPFEKAVENWARSYAAMGINYKNATMTLDLLDRKHKYSNGFCHWPQPAWMRPDGTWQPSSANFTSLADPKAIGSGHTALNTLMHEAGHAAHFANVVQPSPLFFTRARTNVRSLR